MSRPIQALFAICFICAAAAFFLRLSPAQRFEAELSGLAPEVALKRLTEAERAGPLDQNLELRRGQLALRAGETRTAREVFERLAARPRLTAMAEANLAELARLKGDLAQAAVHLDAAYSAEATPKMRMRLGGWYRALRDPAGEIRMLTSVPPESLGDFEASRLVHLLIAARRFDAVETALARLAEQGSAKSGAWRGPYIDFLLDAGRPADALARARAWTVTDTKGAALSTSVAALLDRGAVREATTLAAEALTRRPRTAHVGLLRFLERGYGGVGLALQADWLRQLGVPDADSWATIVEIAARTGNTDGTRAALDLARGSRIDPDSVASALAQILRYGGPRALLSERAWLTPAVLDKAPLLAAALAAEGGLQRPLHDALVTAASLPLRSWELDLWLSLADRLRGTPAGVLLFSEVPTGTPVSTALSGSIIAAAVPPATK